MGKRSWVGAMVNRKTKVRMEKHCALKSLSVHGFLKSAAESALKEDLDRSVKEALVKRRKREIVTVH